MLRAEGLDHRVNSQMTSQAMLKGFAEFIRKTVDGGKGIYRSILEDDTA